MNRIKQLISIVFAAGIATAGDCEDGYGTEGEFTSSFPNKIETVGNIFDPYDTGLVDRKGRAIRVGDPIIVLGNRTVEMGEIV
jgi:hypothetical protein